MATTSDSGEFDLTTFITKNKNQLLAGAAGVVLVGAGAWFWIASSNLKEERAEQAYAGAEHSFYSGNPQLAETDLTKVVQRYGGTTAGIRASVLLAKNYYTMNKPAEGVTKLRQVVQTGAATPFRAAIYSLIGAGYENQSKFDSAATAYGNAASSALVTTDRELYQADQARALASAGKRAEALKIWQAIADRLNSPLSAEAKLRVGELTATPAKGA